MLSARSRPAATSASRRLSSVESAIQSLFVFDPDCSIRPLVVSLAVAAYLGRPWSPYLGAEVRAAVLELGATRVTYRERLYRGLRPRALTPDQGREQSRQLRRHLAQGKRGR